MAAFTLFFPVIRSPLSHNHNKLSQIFRNYAYSDTCIVSATVTEYFSYMSDMVEVLRHVNG